MTNPDHVAIVGGGVAGFAAAQALRHHGYAGTLTIIDPEGEAYDRPPLSKGYLDGSLSADDLAFAPSNWYADHNVTVIADRVTSLQTDAKTLTLAGGDEITADRIVLAVGGYARKPDIDGINEPGIEFLRTKADADRLRDQLNAPSRMVILGAGLIGAEVASIAAAKGLAVLVIDPVELPLVPALGRELAEIAHGMHEAHGVVTVRTVPKRIERLVDGFRVHSSDSTGPVTYDGEVVLVAVGLAPELELAQAAGLEVDDGILVDASGRTSVDGIYAIGDAARRRPENGVAFRRAEHWDSAMRSGQVAAANIVGAPVPAPSAPWFWSDRYGVRVEGTGDLNAPGDLVRRERGDAPPVMFRLGADGRLLGASGIDASKEIRAARKLIDTQRVVTAEQLADPTVELRKIK